MRLCRYGSENAPLVGLYNERGVVSLHGAARAMAAATGQVVTLPDSADLLTYLPPDGAARWAARQVSEWLEAYGAEVPVEAEAALLLPVPRPNKIFLLAGNYAEHIREGGGVAAEREETFPYVFMKPPTTTLTAPGQPVRLPRAAPDAADWELELAVVVGRRLKHVEAPEALAGVAGYTVINDISQRRYRPNPGRKPRERDRFFDWLHGKWFDTFCPCGPCITSADAIGDPQTLRLVLTLNGEVRQDASTAQMIFPVGEILSFISRMVTLEPGDLIATGTPAGVGATSGTFLQPGDRMEGTIERIGRLVTPVEAE